MSSSSLGHRNGQSSTTKKVEQLHPEKKTSLDDKLNKLMYDTVNRMATEIIQRHICTAVQVAKYEKAQSHIPAGKQKCGFEPFS